MLYNMQFPNVNFIEEKRPFQSQFWADWGVEIHRRIRWNEQNDGIKFGIVYK